MEPSARARFNAAYDDARYRRYVADLEGTLGCEVPFRLAETPVFFPPGLHERCVAASDAIVAQLSDATRIARMRAAVPARWNVPNETPLPTFAVVDFAIVREADGSLGPRLVELQGFPSLLGFETLQRDAWERELQTTEGLTGEWSSWFGGLDRDSLLDLARRTIVGEHDPADVVLLDLDPRSQKTYPDFAATEMLFGVEPVCPTMLTKRGRKLYRRDASGRERAIERIYYRLVIDEIERKNVTLPFDLRDELDVEWSPHPNWFFIWSKYSLPFLDHPAVPKTRLLSDVDSVPDHLSERYVLKPLFSFAGGGVNVRPSAADVAAMPANARDAWCLQEKIAYEPALAAADGGGVKVEIRMMYLRPDDEPKLVAATNLCRLARGELLGVDFNKNMTWVGSSIGIWRP
ncbi:MAG: hypothetical protein GIW95_11145 [Candidatus Eremiobacteraeota bacterium]|nr:hypothetical protein [Candidatus Eremiobacteraeota bacterium]